eukprot:s3740_g5.t1
MWWFRFVSVCSHVCSRGLLFQRGRKLLSPSSIKLSSELRDRLICIFRFDFNGTPPKSPLGCWYRAVWSIGAPAFAHAWQYKTS